MWIIAIVVSVLVVVGAVDVAARYQPLTPRLYGYYATRVVASDGRPPPVSFSSGPASRAVWAEPRGTFTVQIELTIDNNGPFPIKVEKISSWQPASSPVRAYFDPFGRAGFAGARKLRPFIVVGHSSQTVVVHYPLRCTTSAVGRIVTIERLPVTFSFLGFGHTIPVLISPLTIRLRRTC